MNFGQIHSNHSSMSTISRIDLILVVKSETLVIINNKNQKTWSQKKKKKHTLLMNF